MIKIYVWSKFLILKVGSKQEREIITSHDVIVRRNYD